MQFNEINMKMKITITGAVHKTDKRIWRDKDSEKDLQHWTAWFECHQCGEEFASSDNYGFCGSKERATEISLLNFDMQQRKYCYRCGYKLTGKNQSGKNLRLKTMKK
jgi:hypothetical protein